MKPRVKSWSPIKGKGRDKSASTSVNFSSESFDLKDVPLNLSEFAELDHDGIVPRMWSIVNNPDAGVGVEDMDMLQAEMEALLAATTVRKITLIEEKDVLDNLEKHKGHVKGSKMMKSTSVRHGIGGSDSRSAKKHKSFRPKSPEPSRPVGLPKVKVDPISPLFDPLQNEQVKPYSETSKPNAPKNETPSRFWAFVEPYCAPVSTKDVDLLEQLLTTCENLDEFYKVPNLGTYYSKKWALEDQENERVKGSGSSSTASTSDGSSAKMIKKGSEEIVADDEASNDLSTRILSGIDNEDTNDSQDEPMDVDTKDVNEELNSKDASNKDSGSLEDGLRKDLVSSGIGNFTDPHESRSSTEDKDEILEELQRCQRELKSLTAFNSMIFKKLLTSAAKELLRQKIREKLTEVDKETMEVYHKITAARAKKRPLTAKEREHATLVLRKRDMILKHLERV